MATPKLGLPELANAAANQTLANQTFDRLDQLVQMRVLDKDLASPPGSPADGAAYIVAASATGTWSGKDGQIAYWRTAANAWAFLLPANGWLVWVEDEARRYSREGGAWVLQASAAAGVEAVVPGFGVAVDSADPANPVVSLKLPAVVAVTASRSLELADVGEYLRSTSATAVALTVDPQVTASWPANAEIHIEQAGAGSVSIAAGAGVAINRLATVNAVIAGQYGVVTLKRTSENVWTLFGALEAAA